MAALARLQADEVGGLGCEWMRPRDSESELVDKNKRREKERKIKREKKEK
jgi:hypothetical protein